MDQAVVSGSFDNLRSSDIRFLEEAARFGSLIVWLWSDALANRLDSHAPKFPEAERLYLLASTRYISQVHLVDQLEVADTLPSVELMGPVTWVVREVDHTAQKQRYCAAHAMKYQVIENAILKHFPQLPADVIDTDPHSKKVVVTGCYDWFHSGHVRFFEEASELGDLYVVVGSDQNVHLLKGEGHPLLPQDERRFLVQSSRYVKQALISTGSGWMDAEPEIARIGPDIYVVNEDGDKSEKRAFCKEHDIEYVVLKRLPKEGLPKRESTLLRGY